MGYNKNMGGHYISTTILGGHSLRPQNMGGGIFLAPLTSWRRRWHLLSLARRSFPAASMGGDQIRSFHFDRTRRFYVRSCTITNHNPDYRSTYDVSLSTMGFPRQIHRSTTT